MASIHIWKAESLDQHNGVENTGCHRRRARHRKVKTGCITCKIRKLRCDEQKPACVRCLSTGRKCDGYSAPDAVNTHAVSRNICNAKEKSISGPAQSTSCVPTVSPSILLSRHSTREIRSYRFFHEVTVPSCSGVFDVDFWVRELPQACHTSPAIWHAVVSLGAIHESCSSVLQPGHAQGSAYRNGSLAVFGLEEFNSSIRHLIKSSSSSEADRWRALTCSIVFTYVCTLQGLRQQALVHLKAGKELLRELVPKKTKRLTGMCAAPTALGSPVSFRSVQSLVTMLDIQAAALQNGGLSDNIQLLIDSEHFNAWRFYDAPSLANTASPPSATPESLATAVRAAESLLNAMVVYTQQRAADIADIMTGSDLSKMTSLIKGQEPFARAYTELRNAVHLFTSGKLLTWEPSAVATKPEQQTAIRTLLLYLSTLKILMYQDPDQSDPPVVRDVATEFSKIVDLAEDVLRNETPSRGGSSFTPNSSPTQPLFLVAHSGVPHSTRQRAIAVMRRYPRREGLWDTTYMAELADCILRREATEDAASGMSRIHDMRIDFDGERRAKVVLRTWAEWAKGAVGKEELLQW